MMLAAESQQVIWLRTMRLAAGGAKAKSEARRMVQEKFWRRAWKAAAWFWEQQATAWSNGTGKR